MKTQKSKNRQKEILKEKQTKMKLCFGNLACKVCDKMKQNLVFFLRKLALLLRTSSVFNKTKSFKNEAQNALFPRAFGR
jgi:hypothetical protein